MLNDCKSPGCHEAMKRCIDSKVNKKTMVIAGWAIFVVIFLPLFITGIQVWSQQESDALRYSDKETVEQIRREQSTFRSEQRHMVETLRGLKDGQKETQKDIKEILKRLK